MSLQWRANVINEGKRTSAVKILLEVEYRKINNILYSNPKKIILFLEEIPMVRNHFKGLILIKYILYIEDLKALSLPQFCKISFVPDERVFLLIHRRSS